MCLDAANDSYRPRDASAASGWRRALGRLRPRSPCSCAIIVSDTSVPRQPVLVAAVFLSLSPAIFWSDPSSFGHTQAILWDSSLNSTTPYTQRAYARVWFSVFKRSRLDRTYYINHNFILPGNTFCGGSSRLACGAPSGSLWGVHSKCPRPPSSRTTRGRRARRRAEWTEDARGWPVDFTPAAR